MNAFERQYRFGQNGENVVKQWLGRQGYFVVPTADIIDRRFRAPSLVNDYSGGRKVLPDFLASCGGSRWVEVKTKTKDVLFNKSGEYRQGIAERLFQDYLFVQSETRIPGYLAFLVVGSPPVKLRIGSLQLLDQHKRRGTMQNVPHVFWPIDIFETHELVDQDLVMLCPAAQPTNTSYPWERAAPATNVEQNYFDFGRDN